MPHITGLSHDTRKHGLTPFGIVAFWGAVAALTWALAEIVTLFTA